MPRAAQRPAQRGGDVDVDALDVGVQRGIAEDHVQELRRLAGGDRDGIRDRRELAAGRIRAQRFDAPEHLLQHEAIAQRRARHLDRLLAGHLLGARCRPARVDREPIGHPKNFVLASRRSGTSRSSAAADVAGDVGARGALLGVAVRAPPPGARDLLAQLGVARAGAQRRAQIDAAGREQAGHQPALDGEARARAAAAEGLAHRRDHADLAAAVAVAIAARHLARVVALERLERQLGVDALDDLPRRHDLRELPVVERADVHELDEAQDDAGAAGSERASSTMRGSLTPRCTTQLILIGARPAALRRLDAFEHRAGTRAPAAHAAEDDVVVAVERDGDAPQPGVGQRPAPGARAARRWW